MRRLIIIGGGISGLAAAWQAVELASRVPGGLEVLVLEAAPEVGGKAQSLRHDGWLVEAGPQGYLDSEPILGQLVRAAGLEGEKVLADRASKRRFVYWHGRRRELSPHPVHFLRSGLVGPLGLARLLAEPLIRRQPSPEGNGMPEESVWSFAARRLGRQVADRLVSPMVLGVFAGDARELSVGAAFPRLKTMELEHGSLLRAAFSGRGRRGTTGPSGELTSFRGGLQELPRRLARRGGFEVRCGVKVAAVEREAEADGRGWRIAVDGAEGWSADALILACEPWSASALLRRETGSLSEVLGGIPAPPVAVVALGFRRQAVAEIPRGFGMLICRNEGIAMLGCLWESYVFPERSPDETLLVRAMYGGAVDPASARLGGEALLEVARRELGELFSVTEAPVFERVVEWERAIPQYVCGHLARVERCEEELARMPGLYLAGNGLHGVAFARAAAAGAEAGRAAVEGLALD